MDLQSLRIVSLLIVGLLPSLLAGCASLVKGSRTSIQLDVPRRTEIRNYSGYSHELAIRRKDSATLLKLRSGRNYLLELQTGERRDSVLLKPKLNVAYILADIFLCWPVALPLDLGSKAAYDFDKDLVTFPLSPQAPNRADTIAPILTISRVDTDGADNSDSGFHARTRTGIVFAAHLGMKMRFNQVPILGNNIGLAGGYRILSNLALTGYYGVSTLMDYAPSGSNIYMEAEARTIALECRFFAVKTLYASAGVGALNVQADSLQQTLTFSRQTIPGFSQWMANASIGAGVAFQGFFLEVRQNFGFDRLRITDAISSPVRNGELRFGLNLEL